MTPASGNPSSTISHGARGDQQPQPRTWGVPERLVPEDVLDDTTRATRDIVRILYDHYVTAAACVAGRRVLDIACGAGYGSRMLKDAGARQVVGVDLSAQAIEYARQTYGSSGIEFVCESALTYDANEPFDVIASYETIEHLPSSEQFLSRLKKMLIPGGTLFLSVPLGETRHIDPYHHQIFSEERILSLLEAGGFDIQASRCEDWTIRLSDFKSWRQQHVEGNATWRELLLTRRGLGLLRQLIRGLGALTVPQLMIRAVNQSAAISYRVRTIPQLDVNPRATGAGDGSRAAA